MPTTVFDSLYFKDRYGSAAMRAIWSDKATLQKWLDVEAALAQVEAELGLIPARAAREISANAKIDKLDLRSMKRAFDCTWNPVVPLVDELRKRLSPKAAGFVHWGATSKNIFDTGLVLQLKESYPVLETRLRTVTDRLARLADTHRDTVMAGRTHGQHALPVTFGFKAAGWLDECLRQEERLESSKPRVLVGEFGGAVGTLASFGTKGFAVQKKLMERLDLGVAAIPIKTAGDRIAELIVTLSLLSATLSKVAQNIYNLQQTDIDEVTECADGKVGSSAMPHKQNPVVSGSVVLLGRLLRSNVGPALDYVQADGEDDHRQGETAWKFVPEVCLLADAQLTLLDRLLEGLVVKPENMRRNLERAGGFVCSEAVLMKLGRTIGRDHAHVLVTELSHKARDTGRSLADVVESDATIRKHLSRRAVERALDPASYLGQARKIIDRVLSAHRRRRGS